ncbi:MAG TPA: helix-turn-helix domain-containing protein, partial [Candidatus Acidoferrum sp.]|nr:helix-turn-helix domain-containing protein [Candidatus Acidoferrum sp.]
MVKRSFGEILKREREMREVTLNEVTVATRIAPRFLEAFEREEWEKLPGGAFNRGFVRAIARYLGLNEENLLSEYDLAYGEQRLPAP